MLYFANDYSQGAHQAVLQHLLETNLKGEPGYGVDQFSESTRSKIRQACECPEADVQFIAGGTQTNQIVIDAMLASYQGVISATAGHINIHEAGAVEYTGHKVIALEEDDGKIVPARLTQYLEDFYADDNCEQMVQPGMVYVTYPTETGTLYSKAELTAIAEICQQYNLVLYLDGARLGYGLASPAADLTLSEIAQLCDVFYIGGTKVGALCGEAVVFTKHNQPAHFSNTIKQHGALLAKGRLLGVQFDALFTDGLYLKISQSAIELAMRLKQGLQEKGYQFFVDSPTNQQFIILPNERLEALKQEISYSFWEKYSADQTVIRLVTSWATTKADVEQLLEIL